MQPDVHARRVIHVARIVQFLRQLLAGVQAAVEIQELHQVNDRSAPVELLGVLAGKMGEDRLDIHRSTGGTCRSRGRGPRCRLRSSGCWRGAWGGGARRRRGCFGMAKDLGHDVPEDTHRAISRSAKYRLPPSGDGLRSNDDGRVSCNSRLDGKRAALSHEAIVRPLGSGQAKPELSRDRNARAEAWFTLDPACPGRIRALNHRRPLRAQRAPCGSRAEHQGGGVAQLVRAAES